MKFGYQLYSARALCSNRAGLVDTIEKIAAMGYDGVEFFQYEGIPATELKALLAGLGLEGFNAHVQLERWEADPEGEARYAAEAGIPCMTIPWLAPALRTAQGLARVRQLVPQLLAQCRAYGVQLLYHNHDFEFAPGTTGRYMLDDILAADPALGLELDTFWALYAGVSPTSYMESHQNRLKLIHVKDYCKLDGGPVNEGRESPTFCAIGTGKMDNAPILAQAQKIGVAWACVEQDNSRIPVLEAAKLSIDSLRAAVK
ncbi:MAG: sugar phosphate isomerase/epimerase [Gemmiger sp.]|nr:sugar phosphate isomerase/epimerase [Gemmiger sp.]